MFVNKAYAMLQSELLGAKKRSTKGEAIRDRVIKKMYSPKIERTIAGGTMEECDAPEKAGIKLRNIAYYPTNDGRLSGDPSSKFAPRCKNFLIIAKISAS
ncbi:hypothetical protein [Microcoleus sp. S13_B4]|uniref:hypothetical protein n=1 Tax=Microcoleus sp. S13_B4 TaxID=3055408 RepID=UPI002FD626F9